MLKVHSHGAAVATFFGAIIGLHCNKWSQFTQVFATVAAIEVLQRNVF